MKKYFIIIFALVAALMAAAGLGAREKTTVALLPFNIYSADNIDYIRQGILGLLSSRLASSEKIEVVGRDQVNEALRNLGGKEITASTAGAIGSSLKADHVVWGSITKIGNSISIDGKLTEVSSLKSPVTVLSQMSSLDDVIPRISEFAQRINAHLAGEPPVASAPPVVTAQKPQPSPAPPASTQAAPQPKAPTSREAEIIAAMRGGTGKKATLTSLINPDFISAPGTTPGERRGFWMSPEFPTEFKGMDIGDVTGDKINEVVMIDGNTIMIYQRKGADFKQIHQIRGKTHLNYLSVDVADINRNGVKEIIVTCLNRDLLGSFVVEYRDGKFVEIASDLRYFLRVIETTPGQPILLGQTYGSDSPFNTQIYEIIWDKGSYKEGRKMKIPLGLSIYGLTIDSLGIGGDKIIVLNELDYLCMYQPTTKNLSQINAFGGSKEIIYRSEEQFGGSNIYLRPSTETSPSGPVQMNTYLNPRILTYDLDGRGRKDIIIPRNISATGKVMANLRIYTHSEIFSLRWDGMGLAENWRTRKIGGYVADYQIKDLNNDGNDEIVLAIVRGIGTGHRGTSVLVSYDLKAN